MDAKPQELLRTLTDEQVLRALFRHPLLTRAELAAETGISKPTAGESVRRLTEAGLVVDSGRRTPGGRGRGRVGSYYALADDVGVALAVSIAPEGVVAECLDPYGRRTARAAADVAHPARPDEVAAALAAAVDRACRQAAAPAGDGADAVVPARVAEGTAPPPGDGVGIAAPVRGGEAPVRMSQGKAAGIRGATAAPAGPPATRPRLAVVSAADPVDRATGRLIQLPDAPFLLGELDPVAVLAGRVAGPVIVDNDVNWAAQAERAATGLADFAYLFLGEGLGCALISDGEVRRGRTGLAGEVAHLITTGPGGEATRFIEVFGALGLRRADSTAIDVPRLLEEAGSARTRTALGRAAAGLIAAVVALADPEAVVLGGSWGTHPPVLDAITEAAADLPRAVPVRPATVTAAPSLAGARAVALDKLRASIIHRTVQPVAGAGG